MRGEDERVGMGRWWVVDGDGFVWMFEGRETREWKYDFEGERGTRHEVGLLHKDI